MSRPSPAQAKTERLLNLVIALLSTRQPLSKARLREAVPDYAEGSDEAFERMFERDKVELRDLGIPLRTEPLDPFFDDELGYRIDEREYALPQVEFEPDEWAVLGLASRVWSQASLAGPAATALRKLEAGGLVRDESSVAGIEPLVHTSEPAFEQVREAVLSRTLLTFDYRAAGAVETTRRQVQPWGLTNWHGRWYLTAHDLGREAPRVFRLDRIENTPRLSGRPGAFTVPPEHDARAMIRTHFPADESAGQGQVNAQLWVRQGAASSLRRDASPDPADGAPTPEGWDRLQVQARDMRQLVEEICAAGPDVRVLGPSAVREAVVQSLERVVDLHRWVGEG